LVNSKDLAYNVSAISAIWQTEKSAHTMISPKVEPFKQWQSCHCMHFLLSNLQHKVGTGEKSANPIPREHIPIRQINPCPSEWCRRRACTKND